MKKRITRQPRNNVFTSSLSVSKEVNPSTYVIQNLLVAIASYMFSDVINSYMQPYIILLIWLLNKTWVHSPFNKKLTVNIFNIVFLSQNSGCHSEKSH